MVGSRYPDPVCSPRTLPKFRFAAIDMREPLRSRHFVGLHDEISPRALRKYRFAAIDGYKTLLARQFVGLHDEILPRALQKFRFATTDRREPYGANNS